MRQGLLLRIAFKSSLSLWEIHYLGAFALMLQRDINILACAAVLILGFIVGVCGSSAARATKGQG